MRLDAFFVVPCVLVTVAILQISAKPTSYSESKLEDRNKRSNVCPRLLDTFYGLSKHHYGCCLDEHNCMFDIDQHPQAKRQLENLPRDEPAFGNLETFQRKRRFIGSSYIQSPKYFTLCRSNVTVIQPIFATSAIHNQTRVQLLQVPPFLTQSIVVHTCEEVETPIVRGYCKQHYKWESVYTVKEQPDSVDQEVVFKKDWILVGAGCDLAVTFSLENSNAPYEFDEHGGDHSLTYDPSKHIIAQSLMKGRGQGQGYNPNSNRYTPTLDVTTTATIVPDTSNPYLPPESSTPYPALESSTPYPAPESSTPYPALESSTPYPPPESSTPYPAPESSTPYPPPESSTPNPYLDSSTPYPALDSSTPYPPPESSTPYPAPESSTPNPPLDSSTPYSPPETTTPLPFPVTTAPEPFPISTTPYPPITNTTPFSTPQYGFSTPAPSTSSPANIYSSNLADIRGREAGSIPQYENPESPGVGEITGRSSDKQDDESRTSGTDTRGAPSGSVVGTSGNTRYANYPRMYQLPDKIGVPVYSMRDNPDRIRSLMQRS